ncbi:hypothetical protein [Lonepinella sp. MS14437]|uniref:hypothetical protein n=1 Tax=Lonepinella sp. MS14437 TaxID=3003620 RepID=UPI0036DCDA03
MTNIIGETKSADKNPVMIRDNNNRPTGKTIADGITVMVRKNHRHSMKFDELLWYIDNAGVEHQAPQTGWRIFRGSYQVMQEEAVKGIPLLADNHLETQTDKEVALATPIKIKAGDVLGLMGEYNQAEENGKRLLHLEVFTYDDIDAFRHKAKESYQQDKKQEKEKRVLQDNFLYADRNSESYAIVDDKVIPLETTPTEVMVPLSEVEKKTVKDGEQSKDYYNIQPYLHHGTKSTVGIYVDDSHLTHGITFPGVNIFHQEYNSLCLFKHKLHDYLNPNSGLTIEEKNQLDPMFKAIMDELDLEVDAGMQIRFEAGRLRDILLDPIQQRRLTGIIARHDNEWKSTRQLDFEQVFNLYRENGEEEKASRLEKRVKDLEIGLKVNQFDTDKEAYFIHPLGVIGWLLKNYSKRIDRDFFFSQYEKVFKKATKSQESALNVIFTAIEDYCETHKNYDCDLRKVAYMLATAKLETGDTFEPITEWGNREYFNKYDPVLATTQELRNRAKEMGNIYQGDGYKYRGRGYVQLTWYINYKKSGDYLNKDLVNNPELALDRYNAAQIMIYGMETGMFTTRKFSEFINDFGCDYRNARRIINGLDNADIIADYAKKLERCLRWL